MSPLNIRWFCSALSVIFLQGHVEGNSLLYLPKLYEGRGETEKKQ